MHSVEKTTDGGYITAGFTQSNNTDIVSKTNESFDFLISKFSSDTLLERQKTFVVLKMHAGGHYWVLRTANSGNLERSKFFRGSFTDTPLGIIKTADNHFIIAGSSDGRFATLEEVINHYSNGLKRSSTIAPLMKKRNQGGVQQLSKQDKTDLKAFLLSLSDHNFISNTSF